MKVTIKLVKAKKVDFVELVKQGKNKKTYKIKEGVPYWLINSKGKIEPQPYRSHAQMDSEEFSDFLMREQVLISKKKYKNG